MRHKLSAVWSILGRTPTTEGSQSGRMKGKKKKKFLLTQRYLYAAIPKGTDIISDRKVGLLLKVT